MLLLAWTVWCVGIASGCFDGGGPFRKDIVSILYSSTVLYVQCTVYVHVHAESVVKTHCTQNSTWMDGTYCAVTLHGWGRFAALRRLMMIKPYSFCCSTVASTINTLSRTGTLVTVVGNRRRKSLVDLKGSRLHHVHLQKRKRECFGRLERNPSRTVQYTCTVLFCLVLSYSTVYCEIDSRSILRKLCGSRNRCQSILGYKTSH